jgi:hypothetical protein
MNRWLLILGVLLALGVMVASPALAQSTAASTQPSVDDGDFAPMLLVMVVLAILVVLFVVAAGVVVGVIAMAILAGLILFGMLSTSLLVGVKSRRFEAAARALFIQLAAIGGIVAGAVAFWTAAWVFELHWRTRTIFLGGGAAGLLLGVLVGLGLNAIWSRVRRWLIARRAGSAFEVIPTQP